MKPILHFLFELVFARWLMRSGPSEEKRHFLISGFTGLGHFILKTAFVKKLEELYPGCKITIIAGNTFGTEFVLKNYRTLILKQESNWLEKLIFFLRLRRLKIDTVFFSFDSSPAFLIRGSIVAGIPNRIGHVFDHIPIPRYYYTQQVPIRRGGVRSEIDMNLDLLQAFYGSGFKRDLKPVVDPGSIEEVLHKYTLKEKRYICLQMGSSNGLPTTKRWLEDHFRTLILWLIERNKNLTLVALGDSGDAHIVNRICEGLEGPRLLNLSGKSTIEETQSLVAASQLLICHDSSLLHLGNALGINVLALYGPSNPDLYALQTPTCHILRKPCDCTPLLGLFPGMLGEPTEEEAAKKCPVPLCMERLKPEEVYAKCLELL